MTISTAKLKIVRALSQLVDKDLFVQRCGSISVKIDEERFLFSAPNVEDCLLHSDTIIEIDKETLMHGHGLPHPEADLHAQVYREREDIGAVLYTRQPYVSAFSACGLDMLEPTDKSKILLGGPVRCTKYARLGTNAIIKEVRNALKANQSHVIILRNHGALCFGESVEAAVDTAFALENAARTFLNDAYLKQASAKFYDETAHYSHVLSHALGKAIALSFGSVKSIFNSSRTRTGFVLYDDEQQIKITFDRIKKEHPIEAKFYNAVYKACPDINYIVVNNARPIIAMTQHGHHLKPILDDFAEQVGVKADMVTDDPKDSARMLKKSSAVLMPNVGALCCADTLEAAQEISFIIEKNCLAFLYAMLFKKPKPLKVGLSVSPRKDYLKHQKEVNA